MGFLYPDRLCVLLRLLLLDGKLFFFHVPRLLSLYTYGIGSFIR